ncbi:MAG: hypothetical protein IPK82_35775 [Polyangiaceae bacterium]|nr:hypothetical protein [Polyangiaceae bacterium]
MSKPPRFRTRFSTTGEPLPGQTFIDYLPDEYADFLAMERRLATSELGFPENTAEGDFAGTLMEMSALVAHVLSLYQDRYANEAFLPTAQLAKSLVRHGRRLAYEPDPGLSATGHLLIVPKEDLSGKILKGFGISSAAVGEKKAQDYETTDDVEVDFARHGVLPLFRTETFSPGGKSLLTVSATGLQLEEGDTVVVKGASQQAIGIVQSATENPKTGTTAVQLKSALPNVGFGSNPTLFARPKSLHLFGWDSNGSTYPDDKLQLGAYPGDPAVGSVAYGYTAAPLYSNSDIYLAEELKSNLANTPVVRIDSGGTTLFTISSAATRAVTFKRVEHIQAVVDSVVVLDTKPTTSISGAVTAFQVSGQVRTNQEIRSSRWLLDWSVSAPILTTVPSAANASQPLTLDTKAEGWKPGTLALFSTLAGNSPEVHEVVRLGSVGRDANGYIQITWEMVNPTQNGNVWKRGNLQISGNVAPISHGKTISEVLGDSDGVTAFQRFVLKQKPVTLLPSAEGATPEIEIRVAGVLWERVVDFQSSSSHDRVYLVQRDEMAAVTIVFGDGKNGAIPAAGKKHIQAVYRIGVGPDGDAHEKAVSRIKKSHPLVDRVENPLPVTNGADPADADAVRSQATGPIKTFDRAVSIVDHRDLALLFPGVARARSLWSALPSGEEGVLVIVANALGAAPPIQEVKAFLQARRDTSVPLHVRGPQYANIYLRVHVEVDSAYLPDVVKSRVVEAFAGTDPDNPGMFTFGARDLGQPAFLSEVYRRLEQVEGISSSIVWHFDLVNLPVQVADTIAVEPHTWLRLLPENLKIQPLPQGGP